MKRLIALVGLLFATIAVAADNPIGCSGANCKVVIETRDGSNVKVVAAQFSGASLSTNRESTSGALAEGVWSAYGSAGNAHPSLQVRSARGTLLSPTATQANDILGQFGGRGYGTSAFGSGDRASIKFVAGTSNWNDTDQAGSLQFFINPAGTSELKAGEILQTGAWTAGPSAAASHVSLNHQFNGNQLTLENDNTTGAADGGVAQLTLRSSVGSGGPTLIWMDTSQNATGWALGSDGVSATSDFVIASNGSASLSTGVRLSIHAGGGTVFNSVAGAYGATTTGTTTCTSACQTDDGTRGFEAASGACLQGWRVDTYAPITCADATSVNKRCYCVGAN